MRNLFLCLMCSLFLLCGQAHAQEITLPPELSDAAPEAAQLLDGNAENGFGLLDGAVEIATRAVESAKGYLLSGVQSVAAIMVGLVILGVLEGLGVSQTVERYTTVTGALWITAVSAGDLNSLIGLGRDTISKVSQLSKCLLPALAAASAATGGVTSASVRQIGTVFFSDILLTIIERLLIPLLYLYIGTAAAAAVVDGGGLGGISSLLKKTITWALSGLLILFTTYLTISGAIAGAADAQAVRLAKSAVSAVVPVVGGILAEAAESVLAGAGLLRGMMGAFGTLAVLSMCLVPFLRLGIQYLLYQAAGFVAQSVGPKKLTKLLGMLGDAFALVLAMTGACALLLIISLISTMTAVTTW